MRVRSGRRLFIAACALGALLAMPTIAGAAEISGTVTARDTGAKLAGISMELYYRIGTSGNWLNTETDSAGSYRFDFDSEGQDARVRMAAGDIPGVYNSYASKETTIGADEIRTENVVLERDTIAPQISLSFDRSGSVRLASVKAASKSVPLPDEVLYGSLLTNGIGRLLLQANDIDYVDSRFSGFPSGSGVKDIGWSMSGGPWTFKNYLEATDFDYYYDRPLLVIQAIPMPPEGIHTISYSATDMNGNASRVQARLVVVDKSAPVTTYDSKTVTTKRLKLKASDPLSGVAATFLRDGKTGPFTYGTSVSVPSKGYKRVQFYSFDKVGNVENIKTLKVSAPARVSTPKASIRYLAPRQRFTVSGSVWDRRSAKGELRIYRYKNGAYRYLSKRAFAEGSDGKYRVTLRLDPGTYKFRAHYGGYTSTWANPPVRSALSDPVTVR